MRLYRLSKKQGFTLIELLVVIAIIGLLATVAAVSLGNTRAKYRDGKRIADIRQIQTALELFYDLNGYYPKRDGGTGIYTYAYSDWGSHCGGWWCDLETFLTNQIKFLPRDPKGEIQLSNYYVYRTHGDGASYGLGAILEKSNDSALNDNGCDSTYYEVGPSLARCGCSPRAWRLQGTDVCP